MEKRKEKIDGVEYTVTYINGVEIMRERNIELSDKAKDYVINAKEELEIAEFNQN